MHFWNFKWNMQILDYFEVPKTGHEIKHHAVK